MVRIDVDNTVFLQQKKVLESALSSNPKTQKVLQKLIRKSLMDIRPSLVAAARSSMMSDPRGAAQGIRSAVYKNILESELKAAEAKLKEARNSFINVVPRHTLNEKEAKIWKLKPTGKASSGNLDDWYLAIKAEDFGTKKVKKPRAVERAEFELSKAVSTFSSKLSKILDEEEMQKLKDLRLIDDLITVKIQKEDNNDFEKDVVSRNKEKGEDQQEKKDDTKRNTDE